MWERVKIVEIVRIICAIFFLICKRFCVLFHHMLHFLYKQILHLPILQHKYCCHRLQQHFFSCVKLSKEVCVHYIEYEPVLLTAEEILYLYDSSSSSSTLTYARVWFLFSLINYNHVFNRTVILSERSWYHHFKKICIK